MDKLITILKEGKLRLKLKVHHFTFFFLTFTEYFLGTKDIVNIFTFPMGLLGVYMVKY